MAYAEDQGLRILRVEQQKHVKLTVVVPGTGELRLLVVPSNGNNCAIRNWKAFTRKLARGEVKPRGVN